MRGDIDVAAVGALAGEPARAAVSIRRGERRVVHITGEGHQALSEQLQVDVAAIAS